MSAPSDDNGVTNVSTKAGLSVFAVDTVPTVKPAATMAALAVVFDAPNNSAWFGHFSCSDLNYLLELS
jgi:hypothetical protein